MISLLMPRKRAMSYDDQDRYFTPFASRTKAGVDVNEEIALTFSTVFLCTRIICEPIASMPIICYERKDNGDRILAKASDVPEADLVTFAPNPEMTAAPWRESLTMGQTNWGGGFSELVRDPRTGRVKAIWPIHPSRIEPNADAKTVRQFPYSVRNNDGSKSGLRRDEVLHVCGSLSSDGIWGRGIIQQARETIGGVLAPERHAAAFWGSGGQPKGVVVAPGLKSPEDKRAFRQQWKEIHGSPDSAEVALLPKDSSYTPFTMSGQDQQFLETRVFSRKVICELYRVPTYMVDESMPGSRGNVESRGAEFIMYCLHPWISKWEQQLNFKLLSAEQRGRFFFEHDFTSMLRGDVSTRMNAYRVGICTGIYTINHCRRLENLPGIGPAGDVNYVPANLFTAEQMEHGSPGGTASGPGPGSDHNGSPADSPLDHQPEVFDRWARRSLTTIQRDDLNRQLADLQGQLTDRRMDWTSAARDCLLDAVGRMLTKESLSAQSAADSKDKSFDEWIRKFYAAHEVLCAKAIGPACGVLKLAGGGEFSEPGNLAAWMKARSVEALQSSFNGDTREVFARKLAEWPTKRAAMLVEEILKGGAA